MLALLGGHTDISERLAASGIPVCKRQPQVHIVNITGMRQVNRKFRTEEKSAHPFFISLRRLISFNPGALRLAPTILRTKATSASNTICDLQGGVHQLVV